MLWHVLQHDAWGGEQHVVNATDAVALLDKGAAACRS